MAAKKIIVGLGNPGREYEKTRHNLGAVVVQRLADDAGVKWHKSRQANALTAEISLAEEHALLVLPLTYMNNSGLAVVDIVHFTKIAFRNILVVCDDIHLGFGEMRLRSSGSHGGHNGLRSLEHALGTESFARLRMGVGSPVSADRQADYVLEKFTAREHKALDEFIEQGVECCRLWLKGEVARAMTEFNQRKDKKDND